MASADAALGCADAAVGCAGLSCVRQEYNKNTNLLASRDLQYLLACTTVTTGTFVGAALFQQISMYVRTNGHSSLSRQPGKASAARKGGCPSCKGQVRAARARPLRLPAEGRTAQLSKAQLSKQNYTLGTMRPWVNYSTPLGLFRKTLRGRRTVLFIFAI